MVAPVREVPAVNRVEWIDPVDWQRGLRLLDRERRFHRLDPVDRLGSFDRLGDVVVVALVPDVIPSPTRRHVETVGDYAGSAAFAARQQLQARSLSQWPDRPVSTVRAAPYRAPRATPAEPATSTERHICVVTVRVGCPKGREAARRYNRDPTL
jgi:hypothetical protein